MSEGKETYEKTGYLHQHYRLFHLKDTQQREYGFHYHDFDKIICFIGGRADYMIEGKKYTLEPYDFILVSRGEIHRPVVDFSLPYERMILYIDHEFLEKYKNESYDLSECFYRAKEEKAGVVRFPSGICGRLYETLHRVERNGLEQRYASRLYGELLFLEFMIQMNRACLEKEEALHPAARYNRKVLEIIEYVNGHMREDLTIDSLAERFYMSKYHMMRQFKKETGYSIHQYILEKRILAAKAMILEGTPATAAAIECGFKDYSTFSRAFRKKTGRMPTGLD